MASDQRNFLGSLLWAPLLAVGTSFQVGLKPGSAFAAGACVGNILAAPRHPAIGCHVQKKEK